MNGIAPDLKGSPWFLLLTVANQLQSQAVRSQNRKCLELLSSFTGRQHAVLREVCLQTMTNPSGISLKQLAEALNLSPGTVSEAVETLVCKQMLERTVCPHDRRAVQIRLAPLGMMIIQTGITQISGQISAFLKSLPETDAEQFVGTLAKFYQFIQQEKGL